jgi:7,8-dihydropterin-6-yl-methyl-4-(beta-D-ribofuranosyl)aminobenzene 5'-phosphate synthase
MPSSGRALCVLSALLFLAIDPPGAPASGGPAGSGRLTITVLYDNYAFDPGLTTAWGFSALIEGRGETILFDTGGDSAILLDNMRRLSIDPRRISVILISHIHGDHTGGLFGLLPYTPGATVYLLHSFPREFKEQVRRLGGRVHEVRGPARILEGVHTTGGIGAAPLEQSLVVESAGGLIVITGCAHPGVVRIVAAVRETLDRKIALVMGGFHLRGMSAGEVHAIIARLKAQEVQMLGPCHCTGDLARRLMREAYGKDFVEVGAGRILTVELGPGRR